MIISEYHIKDLDHGPATLMNPARKVFDEHAANLKAKEDRDLLLYTMAEAAKNGLPLDASPEALRAAAFLPRKPYGVLATCKASFRPAPGRPAAPSSFGAPTLGMDEIQTLIIQAVGRWTERHAADALINLAQLQPFDLLEHEDVPEPGAAIEWVLATGIRADGVDENKFAMSRLRSSRQGSPYVHPLRDYRRLLAVYVRDTLDDDGSMIVREAALLDLTHDVTWLDPSDEERT